MLVVSVVGETGILLLLLQKQLNTSANRLAFCYAVLLAVFRKILFCFSIQADTVSNIFRFFYFWSPRAWGHSVSPLFLSHLYYILCHTKSQVLFRKNLTNVGGCVSHPPTYPNEKYRWVVFPDPWVRVRFTQSPLQKQKGEPSAHPFPIPQNPNPFSPLSPLSCFKPPELLPPLDLLDPPELFLLLLAAEDSCV